MWQKLLRNRANCPRTPPDAKHLTRLLREVGDMSRPVAVPIDSFDDPRGTVFVGAS